jgi:FO synthase subunit 2
MMTLESCLRDVTPRAREVLERSLEGREVSVADGVALSAAQGRDLHALCFVADELRRRQVGERVTYVVNRNINFTNVCIKNCKFCAFARTVRSEQGYFLPTEEVVRRVRQAVDMGATEVCLQAGLSPNLTGDSYVELCRMVRQAAPDVHIHAFSPEEVKFGASLKRVSYSDYLAELKEAGLGSLPGTSAEILDDRLRKVIAPTRITTKEWVEVITSAHALGIPTTSTMMFGHVETVENRMRHMELLRLVQRETGGFTEFVPLSFVHEEAPLFVRSDLPGVRPGPTGDDVLRLYAIARLMIGQDIPNLQASWVKEGLRTSQRLLGCGVNDLGGTLMNESISTAAGARHGQLVTPAALRRVIRDAGREPAQRNTVYEVLRAFGSDPSDDPREPLDSVADADALFGSYHALTEDSRFHYEPRGLRVVGDRGVARPPHQ